MSTAFPINTVVVLVAVMIAAGASAWFTLSRALAQTSLTERSRRAWLWGAALVLAVWLLGRLVLTFTTPASTVVSFYPDTFGFILLGSVIGIGALLVSPEFRKIVRGAPQTWLIGTQALRLAGFLFLALLDMGRLPAAFALPAGYGDMAVGLLALATVGALLRNKPYARSLAFGVNVLGLLDFVSALATGASSIGLFAIQLQAAGVSMAYLNFVLIVPAFGVPLYAVMHVYSLFQLVSSRAVHRGAVSRLAPHPQAS